MDEAVELARETFAHWPWEKVRIEYERVNRAIA